MHRPLILIVDDESKIRRLLAQNLELEGFDVQTASDGAQALEVYNKSVEKPDLILLDLMMPEIDGMSMLKRNHLMCQLSFCRRKTNVPRSLRASEKEQTTSSRSLSTLKN
mgnify:CR=1 FL=1